MAKDRARTTERSEAELVQTAQEAISQSNWVVGECASIWTQRHAKGRTDADFAALVGLSADQIFQRRRVWETFAEARHEFPSLKWSHFYVALNWEDAHERLQWAEERGATVAEMRLERNAGRDELERDGLAAYGGDDLLSLLSVEAAEVRDPLAADDETPPWDPNVEPEARERVPAPAGSRAEPETAYAPFRRQAVTPAAAAAGEREDVEARPDATPQQILRRMTRMLERYNEELTPSLIEELREVPRDLRTRFAQAAKSLSTKSAQLK